MVVGELLIQKNFSVNETTIPQQKHFDGKPFPLILKFSNNIPNENAPSTKGSIADNVVNNDFKEVKDWFETNKQWIEKQLFEYGAIFFRGFPLLTAFDFNSIVEVFGYEELPYVGGAAPRTKIVGKVFTSNESPPDQLIPFHHEMAQVPEFPAKLFFFCELKPATEGETPILLSHVVTNIVESKHPDFVQQLREKGLLYTRILGEEDDPSSAIGRGWQSTFLTRDKTEAEQKAAKLGMKLEWLPDGSVKTISGPLPAIRKAPVTEKEAWFNSMFAAYTGWKDKRNVPERAVTFGDGTPLPGDVVRNVGKVMEEVCVAVPWENGDLLFIDNHSVQHGRRSFEPPRRILAALAK